MKKILLFVILLACVHSAIQAQDVQPSYTPFDRFGNDTIAYLEHNWGTRTSGAYYDRTIGEFLNNFELPISQIEISINSIGEVSLVRFYIRNKSELRPNSDEFDKYSILIWLVFDSAKRPKLHQVASCFLGLKCDTSVTFTWREEYREFMKDWVLEDVQYNYGIFDRD